MCEERYQVTLMTPWGGRLVRLERVPDRRLAPVSKDGVSVAIDTRGRAAAIRSVAGFIVRAGGGPESDDARAHRRSLRAASLALTFES